MISGSSGSLSGQPWDADGGCCAGSGLGLLLRVSTSAGLSMAEGRALMENDLVELALAGGRRILISACGLLGAAMPNDRMPSELSVCNAVMQCQVIGGGGGDAGLAAGAAKQSCGVRMGWGEAGGGGGGGSIPRFWQAAQSACPG